MIVLIIVVIIAVIMVQRFLSSRNEIIGLIFLFVNGGISVLLVKLARKVLYELCSTVEVLATDSGIERYYSTDSSSFVAAFLMVLCLFAVVNLILILIHISSRNK